MANGNGSDMHNRNHGSVTINAPGGPATHSRLMPPSNFMFGFTNENSPRITHASTHDPSAPISITMGSSPSVASPAHSPQPIPNMITGGDMKSGGSNRAPHHPGGNNIQFGSLRSNDDTEHGPRHNFHGQPPRSGRGNYYNGAAQYGRQSYYGNQNFTNRNMPPRPNMSPYGRHAVPATYNNGPSPRMASASPMMAPAQMAHSPNMPPATTYPHPYGPAPSPYQSMPQNMGPHPPGGYGGHYTSMNNYHVPGYFQGMPTHMPYQQQPMGPHSVNPGFAPTAPPFTPSGNLYPPHTHPTAPSMSRNGSAVSHNEAPPPSVAAPPVNMPVIASGSHPSITQSKAPIVVTSTAHFQIPKKSNTIVMKNALGEVVDPKQLKAMPPAAASVTAAMKSPPPPNTSPAPDSKPGSSSTDNAKSADERKKEFRESVQALAKKDDIGTKAPTNEAEVSKSQSQGGKDVTVDAAHQDKENAQHDSKAEPETSVQVTTKEKVPKEEGSSKPAATSTGDAQESADAKQQDSTPTTVDAPAAASTETKGAGKPTLEELDAKGFDNLTPEEQDLYFELYDEKDKQLEAEQQRITQEKQAQAAARKAKEEQERLANAAEEDRKLREQEAEADRLELEKERKRAEREAQESAQDDTINVTALKAKIDDLTHKHAAPLPANNTKGSEPVGPKTGSGLKTIGGRQKPAALNLQPIKTSTVEDPQPSAALQSLRSARFLHVMTQEIYPEGIKSPDPAVNPAALGKSAPFRYDTSFMMQFQTACHEPPSSNFQQQVKNLIGEEAGSRSASAKTPGGAGRQGSRSGQSGYPGFGSFGTGVPLGVRPMPLPTDQRLPGPNRTGGSSGAPIGQFGRSNYNMGTMPGVGISRNPSNPPMAPNSPRTTSRRQNNSKRAEPQPSKQDSKSNSAMPLTQGMDIKPIKISSTGWKPMSLTRKQNDANGIKQSDGSLDPQTVQRKVKAALNKMTPEKFDALANDVLGIVNQSTTETDGRTLRQVIQLVFDKATDEAHWSAMYAKLCRLMLDQMDPEIRDESVLDKNGAVLNGGALFRKYLLNRCQEGFERGWKVDIPAPQQGQKETKETAMLSEEYYIAVAAKRRGLGLVQFIGELYKLHMLTERIMHECIHRLLDCGDSPDEAEVESLCKLLRTIGKKLDESEKSHLMEAYFARITAMTNNENLPSRIRFMLLDVVDLRKGKWQTARDSGPKTLDEIRADAEAAQAQKAAELARTSTRGNRSMPGNRGGDHRGDNRNYSASFNQMPSNEVAPVDLRRLKGSATRSSSHNMMLGPTSMMSSRSNSGRAGRMGPGGPGGALSRGGGGDGGSNVPRQSQNTFALLATADPTSPPSAATSPNVAKATPVVPEDKKAD